MKRAVTFLALFCLLILPGCSRRSMDYIIANEPSLTGIVNTVTADSILIENEAGEYWVSLDVESKDSMTHFSIGDEVVVYYDGMIAETYPMQINTVYAITLLTPAGRSNEGPAPNEVLQFLTDNYDLRFTLWGPEGQDLYALHIYPDHAERECHILMPANTDDIEEYFDSLSWEIVDDELIITGQWQETFRIDIASKTATSVSTGKVYQIFEMEPSLE